MKDPAEIALEMSKPADGVTQTVYMLQDHHKLPLIKNLIDDNPEFRSILIFSSTKKKVNEIVRGLRSNDYLVEGISSDLGQDEREEMLLRFRSGRSRVLVATDVLSRGIDIKDINMVINFDAPSDAEDYVHRVGRTARAEKSGLAVTLITRDDLYKMKRIEKLIGYKVNTGQLPDFIAKQLAKHPAAQTSVNKPGNNRFRRRNNYKGKKKAGKRI